jgi:EF hand
MKFIIPTLFLAAAVTLPVTGLAADEPPGGKVPSTTGQGATDKAGPAGQTRAERRGVGEGGEAPAEKSKGTKGQAGEGRYFPPKGSDKAVGRADFRKYDTNNDGYISSEEAKSSKGLTKSFKGLDKDGDGKLSAQEFGAWTEDKSVPTRGQAGDQYIPPKK